MNAIRIKTHISSERLRLPQLKRFIGKDVEITVRVEKARKTLAKPQRKSARTEVQTLEELFKEHGKKPIKDYRELLGGWPKEELNDGFEEELNRRRSSEIVKEVDLD